MSLSVSDINRLMFASVVAICLLATILALLFFFLHMVLYSPPQDVAKYFNSVVPAAGAGGFMAIIGILVSTMRFLSKAQESTR